MRLQGQLGRVVVLRQMRQARPLHSFRRAGKQDLGGFVVRDMTAGTFDAVFEKFGIGTAGQHLGIVVAFQKDGVQRSDNVFQFAEDVPQIGQNAQAMPAVVHHENHAVHAVVGRRNRFDRHPVESQGFAGREGPEVFDRAEIVAACRPVGFGGGEDRQAEFAMENAHAAGVIGVVVGNQHGVGVGDVSAMPSKPLLGADSAEPGVEQQFDAVGLDVDAVAVAAGLEGNDSHGSIVPRDARSVMPLYPRSRHTSCAVGNGDDGNWHRADGPRSVPATWITGRAAALPRQIISEPTNTAYVNTSLSDCVCVLFSVFFWQACDLFAVKAIVITPWHIIRCEHWDDDPRWRGWQEIIACVGVLGYNG